MEPVVIVASGVVFFAMGLGVGLVLLRQARAAATLQARQESAQQIAVLQQQLDGRDADIAELRSAVVQQQQATAVDRERVVALASDLARAKAEADQGPELKRALASAAERIEQLQQGLHAADMRAAEAMKGLERVPQLEKALQERKAELEGVHSSREQERLRSASLSEQLAKATSELAALESRASDAREELAAVRARGVQLQSDVTALVEERTRLASELEAERKAVVERAAEAERTREQVRAEVEVLTGRLLDEKGKAILHQSREGLEALLRPVSDKLREFEAKVEKTYDQENRDRASLLTSLEKLQEAQARLTKDAESLSRALTGDSKAQGDWGELVLERILETAGLTEGREYDLQVNHVDEDGGRKRPDALVYLPANRVVIVDAKCSLTAFVQAMHAETADGRDAALDAHLASVRAHVRSLSSKSYQDVVKERTLDIVLLFVPNEAAFHAAIGRDSSLYEEAFRQRVVICSPTTLLAALQLISHVWRSEKQNQNAQKIADEAGKLLEKLSAFVADLDDVGARLVQAQSSFATARAKLSTGRGNVIKRAMDLVKLGARARPDKMEPLLLDGADDEGAEVLALPPGTGPEGGSGESREGHPDAKAGGAGKSLGGAGTRN